MNIRKRKTRERKGAAVVELAICLPVLVLLAVGTISANSMIFFKQALKITAYEGARVSLIVGSSTPQVVAQCEGILLQRRIRNAKVSVTPDVESAAAGEIITVSVEAPCADNGLIAAMFFSGQVYSESVSMMKEN